MTAPQYDDQFGERLARYADGLLDAEETQQLETHLRNDPAAMQQFVLYLELHARIAWDARALGDVQEAVPVTRGKFTALRRRFRAGIRFFARPTALSTTVAALVLGLLITAMGFMAPPFYRAMFIAKEPTVPALRPIVAKLTGLNKAVWAGGQSATHRGDVLRSGQSLKLLSGAARIEYDSGAVVALHGPASFVVGEARLPEKNDKRSWGSLGRLQRGVLTAQFVDQPRGLGIETNWGVVLHIGTEFGMAVAADRGTDVEVFDGKVELRSASSAGDDGLIVELVRGESARISHDGRLTSQHVPTRPTFVRAAEFIHVDPPPRQPVALWRFDKPQQLGHNSIGNLPVLTVIGDARYATHGRYGGAIALDGDGDMLEATGAVAALPVGNSPYTIAAWIKPEQTGVRGIVGWGAYGQQGRVNALRLEGANGLKHYWWGNDLVATNKAVAHAGIDFAADQWVHVAVTWDGRLRQMFVNGRLIGADQPTPPNVTNEQFAIGRTAPAPREFFTGLIDDVAIYRQALGEPEIVSVMEGDFFGNAVPAAPR